MMGDELYAACQDYGEKLAKARNMDEDEIDALLAEGIPLAVGLVVDIAASLDSLASSAAR